MGPVYGLGAGHAEESPKGHQQRQGLVPDKNLYAPRGPAPRRVSVLRRVGSDRRRPSLAHALSPIRWLKASLRDADEGLVEGLTVTRWARYGKERLYVATADRSPVGYLDVQSGDAVLDRPDLAAAFQAAVTDYLASRRSHTTRTWHPETSPGTVSATVPTAPAASSRTSRDADTPVAAAEATWVDLAANRPGQAAQAQAEAHLAAMKERSRLGTFVTRALDMKTDERAWRVGAKGEETVGARLERLVGEGWWVLHAVPVGTRGSDIDHVLMGPGGVYTVNTKSHPGKKIWVSPHRVLVDGHKVEYLRNSRFEADRSRRLLTAALGWEPPVRAALVLLTGTLIPDVTIKDGGPEDVLILDRMDVPRIFKRSPQRLTPEGVAEVFEIARRSTTWTG